MVLFKSLSLQLVLTGLIVLGGVSACGFNFYEPVALNKETDAAQIEEARIKLDAKDYAGAKEILDKLVEDEDTDSNQVRILHAAALLGNAGFDFWQLILDIFEDLDDTETQNNGLAAILESFSDNLLGQGSEREQKVLALAAAVSTLRNAPNPSASNVNNMACFFAGVLTIPAFLDVQTSLSSAITALETISRGAVGGECESAEQLTSPLAQLNNITANISAILAATRACPFLDPDGELTNDIEVTLNRIISSADKGCSALPQCPSALPNCHDLFPSCVREALGVGGASGAAANDRRIDACEVLLHCTDPSQCFQQ